MIIMPLKSDYNHIICIMEGETKNIRFVLKIYRIGVGGLKTSVGGIDRGGVTLRAWCGLRMRTL